MQPSTGQQVAFLSRVPLFRGMGEPLIEILAGIMVLERFKAGHVLCRENTAGAACFVVAHGQVEVFNGTGDDEKVLSTLGAGHVVGEVALVDGGRRSASVRCKTDASVFTLARSDFERLLHAGNKASLHLLDNIAQALAMRVRTVSQRYTDIFSKSGETMQILNEKLTALRATVEAGESGDDDPDETESLMKLLGYQGQGVPSSR